MYSYIESAAIKIGEDVRFLDLGENLPLAQQFYNHLNKIKLEIIYKSIYGDQWKLTKTVEQDETIEWLEQEGFPESEQFKN